MIPHLSTWMVRTLLIVGLVAMCGCADSGTTAHVGEKYDAAVRARPDVVVASRLKGLAHYPCEQCHRHVEDSEGRVVNSHTDIRVDHMPDGRCETCHLPEQPGRLKLASGEAIELEDAHTLCGQCHSEQLADWSLGIHGKQVGNWQRELHRYACTRCHNPHNPEFGTMTATPPPPFPRLGIPKGEH